MLLYGIIYIFFEKHLPEKQVSVYIMKPCGEIGQYFEESLRGGKLVPLSSCALSSSAM